MNSATPRKGVGGRLRSQGGGDIRPAGRAPPYGRAARLAQPFLAVSAPGFQGSGDGAASGPVARNPWLTQLNKSRQSGRIHHESISKGIKCGSEPAKDETNSTNGNTPDNAKSLRVVFHSSHKIDPKRRRYVQNYLKHQRLRHAKLETNRPVSTGRKASREGKDHRR